MKFVCNLKNWIELKINKNWIVYIFALGKAIYRVGLFVHSRVDNFLDNLFFFLLQQKNKMRGGESKRERVVQIIYFLDVQISLLLKYYYWKIPFLLKN
jgi:hypothetical protein